MTDRARRSTRHELLANTYPSELPRDWEAPSRRQRRGLGPIAWLLVALVLVALCATLVVLANKP